MYQLVEVIHKEAQFVDIQAQFLADDKLTRHIRKNQGQTKLASSQLGKSSSQMIAHVSIPKCVISPAI